MPKLGLSNSLSRSGGLTIPGLVYDNLVMKHDYSPKEVQPLSDGALYLDNTNGDYVNIDSFAGTLANADPFSLCCWFLGTATTTGANEHLETIFGGFDGVTNKLRIMMNTSAEDTVGGIYISDNDTAANATLYSDGSSATNGTQYNDSKWHHLAVTNASGDGATTTLVYVDGLPLTNYYTVTSGSGGGSSDTNVQDMDWTNMANFTIGADIDTGPTYNDVFTGYLCNMGIWKEMLTQEQIKSIMFKRYEDLSTSETTNLKAWWSLDSEVGSDGNAGTGYVLDNNSGAGSTTNLGTIVE